MSLADDLLYISELCLEFSKRVEHLEDPLRAIMWRIMQAGKMGQTSMGLPFVKDAKIIGGLEAMGFKAVYDDKGAFIEVDWS